jgi:hypothetical protein
LLITLQERGLCFEREEKKKNDRDKRNFHVLIHLKSLMKFSLVLLTKILMTFYFSILSPVLSKITEGNVVIIFVAKLLMKYIFISSIAFS